MTKLSGTSLAAAMKLSQQLRFELFRDVHIYEDSFLTGAKHSALSTVNLTVTNKTKLNCNQEWHKTT